MRIRHSICALSGVCVIAAVASFGGSALAGASLTSAMPQAPEIGSGWQQTEAPKLSAIQLRKSQENRTCQYGFLEYVHPVEAQALYRYQPTTSQLRVTLFAANDRLSESNIWRLVRKCGGNTMGQIPSNAHIVQPLAVSRSENGEWWFQSETVGRALSVLYVAQVRDTVGFFAYFGSGDLATALTAVKGAAANLSR